MVFSELLGAGEGTRARADEPVREAEGAARTAEGGLAEKVTFGEGLLGERS